jgi:hypothetical protein
MYSISEQFQLGFLSTAMILKLQSEILNQPVLTPDDLCVLSEIRDFFKTI